MEPLHPDDPRELGRFRLLRRVGEGGMGVVFLAVSTDSTGDGTPEGTVQGAGDDLAAVKAIRPEYSGDREFRARFASEVELARRVRGPYTARVLDADTDGRHPWLATEYVPGPSLHDAVRDSGPFPEPSLRALAAGLAEALAAIHGVGLIHRDLKPSNVLLSPRGPQVIDFGIARAADATALTRTGQTLGTPAYMSPEQAVGSVVDPRSDLFSFGGVLLFTATGRQPFGTGSAPALLYRVVNEEPDLSGVPEALRPLVTACLAKDPADRPDLGSVLDQLTGTALPRGDEDPTEWLPEAVATQVLRTTAAATKVVPTLAVTSKAVPKETVPKEAPAPAEEPAASAEALSAESDPAEAPSPTPGLQAAKVAGPQPAKNEAEGVGAPKPKREPRPALDWSSPDRDSQRSDSHTKWPWAAAAVAVLIVSVLALAFVDGQAPGARPDTGDQADAAITPSPSASPSPTRSPDAPQAPEPEIRDTVFLGGGERFVVLSASGLDIFESGQPEAVERLTDRGEAAALSNSDLVVTPDGSMLAAVAVPESREDAAEMHVWDLDTSERHSFELPEGADDDSQFALSPDGETLYFGDRSVSEDTVFAYRSRTGEELFQAAVPEDGRGTIGSVNGLAVSPDGELFAALNTGLATWDATTGETHPSHPELRETESHVRPDGPIVIGDGIVVTGTYRSVLLWDMHSDDEPEEFSVREGSFKAGARLSRVALGDGGNRIYAAGHAPSERNVGFLTVWDREGEVVGQGRTDLEYPSLSTSLDDDRVLVSFVPLDYQGPEEFVFLDGDLEPVQEFTVPTR